MYLEAAHRGYGRGNRKRWAILVAVLALGAAVGVIAVTPQGADVKQRVQDALAQRTGAQEIPALPPPVPVKTAKATAGAVSASLFYSGDVRPIAQVNVLPKGTGVIEKLNVDVGSKVKAGDVIAELDAASLRAEVSRTQANLAAARARYASLESGPRVEQVAQAAAALDAAQARRDALTKGASGAQIQAAQSNLDTARANLQIATARLEAVKQGSTQTEWGEGLATVDQTRAQLKTAELRLAEVKAGPSQAQILQAQQSVDVARANLIGAQERLAAVRAALPGTPTPAGLSVAQAEAAAVAAQTTYDSAVAALNLVKSRPLPAELQAAQSDYDSAKAAYEAAAAHVDQMKRGATPEDVRQAEAAVASAEATVASAEATLNQVMAGPSQEELRQVDNAVKQAQQGYSLASNPYTKSDFDAAMAAVMQAQADVERAESALGIAQVVSPIDGVVTEKFHLAGQPVSSTTPIVAILSSGVELVVGVEESQVGQVAEGQKAEITVATYPGTVFSAKVTFIAASGNPADRTFQVSLSPEDNDGKLRAGMQAQVRIFTQEKGGAVVVPKGAIVTKGSQRTVFVVSEDTVQLRQVKLGLPGANGTMEVADGVQVGDEVVVSGQDDLRDGDKIRRQ